MSPRHVGIIATCCLTCGVPAAMILSTAGLFYPIIASDLGVPTAKISAWMSVSMLTSAVFSPFVGNLLARYNVRNFMVLGVLAGAVAFLIFSQGTEPWMFWVAGGIAGFTLVTCLSLLPTVLVNRWFGKHVGLIIGFCTSFTGIGGVVFLALGQGIIDEFGWRAAYAAFAVIALTVCVPAVLVCVRDWPADCGLEAYGAAAPAVPDCGDAAEPAQAAPGTARQPAFPVSHGKLPSRTRSVKAARWRAWMAEREAPGPFSRVAAFLRAKLPAGLRGKPAPENTAQGLARSQMRTPAFWLLVGSGFFMNLVCQVNGYFPLYVDWLDGQAAYGAMAGSFTTGAVLLGLSQAGNAAGKIGLGVAVDLSPGKALAMLGACGALGVGCVWLSPSTPLMAAGGLVFGFFVAGGIVLLPMLVRTAFGTGENYPIVLSRISMAPTVGSAVGNIAFPLLAEGALGFDAMFALAAVCVAISIVTGYAAVAAPARSKNGFGGHISSESID